MHTRGTPLSERQLCLTAVTWSRHQVVMRFALDDLGFSTVYWYPEIDLLDLDRRYGRDFMERVHVHSALFELLKLASLRPDVLDLGPYSHHHTAGLERLWRIVFHNAFGQWRYENDLPEVQAPRWASRLAATQAAPRRLDRHAGEVLFLCGGGKDSLVSMKLLERGAIPYASLAYTSSVYGRAQAQLDLIDRLLTHGAPRTRHSLNMLDDFFDAPLLSCCGREAGVRTLASAETVSGIFAALPILLSRGYPHAVVGHEASANRGNLVWDRTGEEINHQWAKSQEAERLIDDYLRTELCEDTGFFSILAPLHDVAIFALLRRDLDAVPATHSCNVRKPWCCRCPKCAYVWLGYRAYLPDETVRAIIPEDLLEVRENHGYFHDMMGLGAHTPFECIGEIEESRLALRLCQARGLLGPHGATLAARLPPLDITRTLDRFLRVDAAGSRIPRALAGAVLTQMEAAATQARAWIIATLSASTV